MATGFIQSNTLFFLRDILSSTVAAGATFRISNDIELGEAIETGALDAFVVLKNQTQLERMLITATGGIGTIVKRGLEQDGVTENILLQKDWNDGTIGYFTVKPDDFVATDKLDRSGGLRIEMGTAQNIGATNASTAITVADTKGWTNGASITGTGIPNGTTIVSFVPNTSAVLSANFTGTTGTVSVIVGRRQVLEIDANNNEVEKVVSDGLSIQPSETIRKRKADGTYEDVPFSFFLAEITAGQSQNNIAGESLSVNDLCVYEYMHTSNLVAASGVGKYLLQPMGNVVANTRLSMKIVGNGISASTLNLGLGKVAGPTDNIVVRIETDDGAGKPSGTLAHANATANIAGTGLTTGIVNTTVTFGGAFTLTDKTLYHIVIQRQNAVDGVNYYIIGTITKNVRMLKVNSHNGTSWQTESAVKTLYCIYSGAYSRYIVKAVSSSIELNWFDGINTSAVSVGQESLIAREGLTSGWSGLTNGADYYLSSSAGLATSTRSATAREIGYAVGMTKMYIKNPLFNPSNYEYSIDNWQYYINEGAVQGAFISNTFRIQARGRMVCAMVFSGGSGTMTVYNNNTQVVFNNGTATAFQVYPGDIVTCNFNPSTGAFGRQIGMQMNLPPLLHLE